MRIFDIALKCALLFFVFCLGSLFVMENRVVLSDKEWHCVKYVDSAETDARHEARRQCVMYARVQKQERCHEL